MAVISIAWLATMPLLLLVGIPIGAPERYRLGFMEPLAVPDPHALAPPSGWEWVRLRVTALGATFDEDVEHGARLPCPHQASSAYAP